MVHAVIGVAAGSKSTQSSKSKSITRTPALAFFRVPSHTNGEFGLRWQTQCDTAFPSAHRLPNVADHPKVPSPLRSSKKLRNFHPTMSLLPEVGAAGALQKIFSISARVLRNRAIFPIGVAHRRRIWTAVASVARHRFFKRTLTTERYRLSKSAVAAQNLLAKIPPCL